MLNESALTSAVLKNKTKTFHSRWTTSMGWYPMKCQYQPDILADWYADIWSNLLSIKEATEVWETWQHVDIEVKDRDRNFEPYIYLLVATFHVNNFKTLLYLKKFNMFVTLSNQNVCSLKWICNIQMHKSANWALV